MIKAAFILLLASTALAADLPPVPAQFAMSIATNTPGTLPADIRAKSLAAGTTTTRADGTTRTIGAPVRRDTMEIVQKSQPRVVMNRSGMIIVGELAPVDTRPYYKTKVWNELTGSWTEFRAYNPGNTSFFQTELVVPEK